MTTKLAQLKAELDALEKGQADFVKNVEIQANTQIASYTSRIDTLRYCVAVLEQSDPDPTAQPEKKETP